jgi:hypothetical protein
VDEARAQAEELANAAARAVESTASVEAEVGDSDPLQAIEDALRAFPADEVIIVTAPTSGPTGSRTRRHRKLSGGSGFPLPTSRAPGPELASLEADPRIRTPRR